MRSCSTAPRRVIAIPLLSSEPPCNSAGAESEWKRRLASGDPGAFEEVFHFYYNGLCLFAERWLGSPDLAEDVVCDVFCRIWKQRTSCEIHSSLKGYLYGAVRNGVRHHLRHQQVRNRVEASSPPGFSPGMGERYARPDEELETRRLATAIEDTLEELPSRSREAFVLQRSHSLSYSEVAEVMGISVSTVEKHMIRAIGLLRDRLACWY